MVKVIGIEWDQGNTEKCQSHGVSMAEIDALLLSKPLFAPDVKHSKLEQRYITTGRTEEGRALFVAFTLRHYPDGSLLRPVSARYMHAKEVKAYEKEST